MIALLVLSIYLIIGLVLSMLLLLVAPICCEDRYAYIMNDICDMGTSAVIVYLALLVAISIAWPVSMVYAIMMRTKH